MIVKLIVTVSHNVHFVLFLLVASGVASLAHINPAYSAESEQIAQYTGPISAQNNNQFFQRVRNRTIKRLLITSSGGDVQAGIELGRWVYAQQIDVVVEDYCLSSCANYVFPAARYKTIKPGAVVAWHGNYHHLLHTGLWRDEVTTRIQRYRESAEHATQHVHTQVQQLVTIEKAFFKDIGVDQYLCWIGKQQPYNAPDYYFMSAEDMARFGVTDVMVPHDYRHTDVSRFSVDIILIRLSGKASKAHTKESRKSLQ